MSTQVGEIHFDLDLDHRKFSQGVKQVDGDTDKLDGSLGRSKGHAKALGAAMAVAGAAVVAFGVSCVKAFQESESMIAQTNAVIKSTGGVAGVTAKDVTKLASSLQRSTAFSDEQVRSAQNMALTFTGIGKDIFPDVTKTALDMATALNHGITPSGEEAADTMKLLGKALQDPDAGLGALKRVGVNVDELSKKFTDSMSIQEKQKLILKELGTEFGGSATAAAKTFQGRVQQLKNQFNDFQETIGKFIVKGLLALYVFVNKRIIPIFRFLGEHINIVLPILIGLGVAIIALVIPPLVAWTVATLAAAAAQLLLYAPIIAIGLAIATVVGALVYAYTHWEGFRKVVDTVIRAVTTVIKWAWENVIKPVWTAIVWYITNILVPYWKMIGDVVVWVWEKVIKPIWDAIWAYVTNVLVPIWTKIWDVASWVWDNIWRGIQVAWDFIKPIWDKIYDYIVNTLIPAFQQTWDKVKDVWDKIKNGFTVVKDSIGENIQRIKEFIQDIINKVQEFIDKVKEIAGAVKNAPGKVVDKISDIFRADDHRADGGPVAAGRSYIVGEQGPELFTPSGSGTIIPNHELGKSTGGSSSGGGNVYLNIDASGIMATSRSHQRQVISTLIEAANEELIGRGLAPIADNKLRAAV